MISKTKESGRADLLIRMPPELKERIEKAARLVGMTKTDWVLQAIEAILHVQELQAKAQEEVLAIRLQQEAKFEEIVASLAAEQKLGDLASLTTKNRTRLEATADKKLENWRSERRTYGDRKPKTQLDRLCEEFERLGEEEARVPDRLVAKNTSVIWMENPDASARPRKPGSCRSPHPNAAGAEGADGKGPPG